MKKTNLSKKYETAAGELITIVMTPRDGAGEGNVTASSNGANNQFSSGNKPSLRFNCKTGPGEFTSAKISCSFPGNPGKRANFLIEVSGKQGEDTDSFVVSSANPAHEPELRFENK